MESSSSDEEYLPNFEDSDSESLSTDDSNDDVEDVFPEGADLDGGWAMLSDIFADQRQDDLPIFDSELSGLDPVINGEETFSTPKAAFEAIF